ncbi:MAG: ribosome maturation factor RimM [Deltaproteobacteria bacterium]|jgi:16S rRNA processing protein RimM|nr:ribosome maturation factor RimM [Deltaproteobacteria bacterium]
MDNPRLITLGRVLRAHGVHGAVRVAYYGNDPLNALKAARLWLIPPGQGQGPVPLGGHRGKIVPGGFILKLNGYATREAAETLSGAQIAVARSDLPDPGPDEYYQADLLGLEAVTDGGRNLGRVGNIIDQGDFLVLVITDQEGRETLVPFSEDSVPEVDLGAGRLVVSELPGLLDQ